MTNAYMFINNFCFTKLQLFIFCFSFHFGGSRIGLRAHRDEKRYSTGNHGCLPLSTKIDSDWLNDCAKLDVFIRSANGVYIVRHSYFV